MVITLAVALVITLFAAIAPVSAKSKVGGGRVVFESDIIDPDPAGGDSLVKGEVYIRADGAVKVEIEGVSPPGKEYEVLFRWGPCHDPEMAVLGSITTDSDGYGMLETTLWAVGVPGMVFMPRIAIQDVIEAPPVPRPVQFHNGFDLPVPQQ